MKIIRGLNQKIAFRHQGCVATMGKFDGIHCGHQAIIAELKAESKQSSLPSVVILFEPHPQEFFQPEKVGARITRLREKLFYLQQLKVDYVLVLAFNSKFASMSAEDFVKNILVNYLNVKHFFVGDDFYFGAHRQGDWGLLKKLADQFHFQASAVSPLLYEENRISSSLVRAMLTKADLDTVKKLLGRHYSLHGRVSHGAKRGRTIGFPTANLYLHRQKSPILGVYAVEMRGIGDHPLPGVANIGSRPTVDGTRVLLEVFLFDFDQDIYGRYVQVDILHKLRDEKRYDSFEALKMQIHQDVEDAKRYFIGM